MMRQTIIRGRPPNFERIAKVFPAARGKGVIFSYGDKIYLPDGGTLPHTLLAHEAKHGERQGTTKESIEAWWDQYLTDPQFRFLEELEAHRAEYAAYRPGRHGMSRAELLHVTANRMSGDLYHNMCSYADAVALIKNEIAVAA